MSLCSRCLWAARAMRTWNDSRSHVPKASGLPKTRYMCVTLGTSDTWGVGSSFPTSQTRGQKLKALQRHPRSHICEREGLCTAT